MEEEKKKTTFYSYFRHISLCFYSNFDRESSLDAELNSTSNAAYFWQTLLPQKQEIPEKIGMMMSSFHFSGMSCFWGSGVCQKYVVWVILGCIIKLCIQWALPLRIWVKTWEDMSKIRKNKNKTKKVFFFILPPKLITIILLF